MRAIAILALLSTCAPAYAQDTFTDQPTGAAIGRIVVVNQVQADVYNRSEHVFGDVNVVVHYTSTPNYGGNDTRDRVHITVPDGYVAIPPEYLLPENESVEVMIYEAIVG